MKIAPTKTFLALDISDLSLRLIQIKHSLKRAKIASFNEIRLPAGIIKGGEIIDKKKMTQAITQLIKTQKGEKIFSKHVVACLPEKKSFIKLIRLSTGQENGFEKELGKEIARHVPYRQNEIYFDWQIIEKMSDQQYLVLISACPRNIVDDYLTILEEARLKPLTLEVESQALVRSLINKETSSAEISMIIDIGLNRSTFVIASKKAIYSSYATNKISGNVLTNLITKKSNLSGQEAEKIKISAGVTDAKTQAAGEEYVNTLIQIIKQNVNYYKENFPAIPLKNIILSGGGAYTKGLAELIKKKLGAKTIIGDPWTNLPALKDNKLISNNLSYSTVIGLALRIFMEKI